MNNNPFDNYRGTSDSAVRSNIRELPMRWYKFLIWVALWISAAVNILYSFSYITGTAHAEELVAQFPMLTVIDLLYGVLTLGMGALALYTRFALAGFKRTSPKLVVGLYTYGLVISLGYNIAVLALTSSTYGQVDIIITIMSVITSAALNAAMVGCNYVYFKKRRHMFNK